MSAVKMLEYSSIPIGIRFWATVTLTILVTGFTALEITYEVSATPYSNLTGVAEFPTISQNNSENKSERHSEMALYTVHSTVTVVYVSPSASYNNFISPAHIIARFSEPVDPSSVTASEFTLKDSSDNEIHGTVKSTLNNGVYDPKFAMFTPEHVLTGPETFTASLDGIKDSMGNTLAPYQWSFTIKDPSNVIVNQGDQSQVPPGDSSTGAIVRDHRNNGDCQEFQSLPVNKDSDGDKIPDVWEVCGIDVNEDGRVDLDLKSLGSHPYQKDIFVEVDYMGYHKPLEAAMNDVVTGFRQADVDSIGITKDGNSFDNPGIRLHIQIDDPMPHRITFNWDDLNAIKRGYFGTEEDRASDNFENIRAAKSILFHYALFVHEQDGTSSSGLGEVEGNDFIVSLGSSIWGKDQNGHSVGSRDEQAGTFMHELGHNIGLSHGGSDELNYKPNYVSVMNYMFQMPSLVPNRPLDYSRCQGDTLVEQSLSEVKGISFDCPRQLQVMTYIPSLKQYASSGSSIDFNADGDTLDVGIIKDLNGDNFPVQGNMVKGYPYSLSGNDDWSDIKFYIWYIKDWLRTDIWTKHKSIFSDAESSRLYPGGEFSGEDLINHRLLLLEGIVNEIKRIAPDTFNQKTTAGTKDSLISGIPSSITSIASDLKISNLDSAIGKVSDLSQKVQSLIKFSDTNAFNNSQPQSEQKLTLLLDNLIKVLELQK